MYALYVHGSDLLGPSERQLLLLPCHKGGLHGCGLADEGAGGKDRTVQLVRLSTVSGKCSRVSIVKITICIICNSH